MEVWAYEAKPCWHFLAFWLPPESGTTSLRASILVNSTDAKNKTLLSAKAQCSLQSKAPIPDDLALKQSVWDHLLVTKDLAALQESITSDYHWAPVRQ